jgi:hypothetical protein
VRDYDWNPKLYAGLWLSFKKSWITNDLEMEKLLFEIWNVIRHFPEALTSESIEEISQTIPRDLCSKSK